MTIFESLENLNVSEECFNDIIIIVEEYINEVSANMLKQAAANSIPLRKAQADSSVANYDRFVKSHTPSENKNNPSFREKAFHDIARLEHAKSMGSHTGTAALYEPSKETAKEYLEASKVLTKGKGWQDRKNNKKYVAGN